MSDEPKIWCGFCGGVVSGSNVRRESGDVYHLPCSPTGRRELARASNDQQMTKWWIESQARSHAFTRTQIRKILDAAVPRQPAAWLAELVDCALSRTKGTNSRPAPPQGTALPLAPNGKRSFAIGLKGRRFRLRWIRHKPFLYEIVYRGVLRRGRPDKAAVYQGIVDEKVALQGPKALVMMLRRNMPLAPSSDRSRRRTRQKREPGGV